MKKLLLSRKFSAFMSLMLCLIFVMAPVAEVSAASKTYYLPVRFRAYKRVNGQWKKQDDYKYKYDKKGNIKYWAGQTLKLKYSSGKLKKVSIYGTTPFEYVTTKQYNKKGRITRLDFDCDEAVTGFKYSYNKRGYIAKKFNLYTEETTKYAFRYHSNKLPSKITETWTYDGVKYKNVEKYNKAGILTTCKEYRNGKVAASYSEKITKSKGKIKKIIESGTEDGKKFKWKYVFTYGTAKTKTKKKYVAAMSMMMGSSVSQTIGDTPIVGYCYYNVY